MRTVVGDHSVNEVLTTGRQKIATEAKDVLQALADRYEHRRRTSSRSCSRT